MTPVTDRNCTGGGQARPGETDEFQGGSGLVTPYEQCRMRIQSTAKRMVSEMRGDNRATLAAMDSLLEGLRDFEARKTIVYISNGIVFDSPHVAGGATPRYAEAGLQDRCRAEGGDFFKAVPAGDAYVMKHIIHDWPDDKSTTILRNCREAARPAIVIVHA